MNKGYFFDFAVYSSVKVIQGKIFFPKYHIDRLFESAAIIDLSHKFTKKEVLEWLNLVVKKNQLDDTLLRIILIGDPDNENAKLYILPLGLTYYPREFYKRGAKVITYRGERRIPKSKSKDLFLNFLALREAKKEKAVEALLIDNDGNVREGTRSNFFAIKDNNLITPPKEKVLEGITKKIVLQICKKDFAIKEQDIPLSDIKKYDEFFITSTSMNILPISQINNIKFQSDFEKTRLIQKLFKEYYNQKVLGK